MRRKALGLGYHSPNHIILTAVFFIIVTAVVNLISILTVGFGQFLLHSFFIAAALRQPFYCSQKHHFIVEITVYIALHYTIYLTLSTLHYILTAINPICLVWTTSLVAFLAHYYVMPHLSHCAIVGMGHHMKHAAMLSMQHAGIA